MGHNNKLDCHGIIGKYPLKNIVPMFRYVGLEKCQKSVDRYILKKSIYVENFLILHNSGKIEKCCIIFTKVAKYLKKIEKLG